MRIALVSTVPYFLVSQLQDQIIYMVENGIKVALITSPGVELELMEPSDNLSIIRMDIPRKLHPIRDMLALVRLIYIFKKMSFDIVHSTTPKAGLLSSIAAKITSVPLRLHTFTGQAWVTKHGIMRLIMRISDRIILKLSTCCFADSNSQRLFLIEEKIAKPDQITVSGSGTLAGVNIKRFSNSAWTDDDRERIKDKIGIYPDVFIITFIGRITKDKGINECLLSFEKLRTKYKRVALLLVGPIDDVTGSDIINKTHKIPAVFYLGQQKFPEEFLAISDVLCLPSYREGFGTVILEAAAMGVPAIGTNIVGLSDAIIDGETGLLVEPGNPDMLYLAIKKLIDNPNLRKYLGDNAKKRCILEFDSNVVNQRRLSEYKLMLRKQIA